MTVQSVGGPGLQQQCPNPECGRSRQGASAALPAALHSAPLRSFPRPSTRILHPPPRVAPANIAGTHCHPWPAQSEHPGGALPAPSAPDTAARMAGRRGQRARPRAAWDGGGAAGGGGAGRSRRSTCPWRGGCSSRSRAGRRPAAATPSAPGCTAPAPRAARGPRPRHVRLAEERESE